MTATYVWPREETFTDGDRTWRDERVYRVEAPARFVTDYSGREVVEVGHPKLWRFWVQDDDGSEREMTWADVGVTADEELKLDDELARVAWDGEDARL